MLNFFIIFCYIMFAYGFSLLSVFFDGPFDIVDKIRKFADYISPSFGKVFGCMACFSTWVGIIFSTLNYFLIPIKFTPFNIILGDTHMWYLIIFMDCMFTCGTTWGLYQLEEMIERIGKITYEDE